MPKKTKEELTEGQKKFITNKVKELGDLKTVCEFYSLNDEVSQYAHNLTSVSGGKRKIKTVKRKRKIEAIIDEE